MARKNNANNPLQLKVRAASLPKNITPNKYYQRLIQVITEGRPLPLGWDVRLAWRNPGTHSGKTKRWQYDDFEGAVNDSREGFNALLHDALVRRLRRFM